jgi:hypothetical protein
MASTFSNIGIELIPSGFQSGTWGDTTNVNLQIIDRLTSGVGTITLSGTTHTLSTNVSGSATLSDGQYSVLVFGGSPSGTNTVTISPNTSQHVYLVKNISGQSVVLTQGSGGNVTVADGKSAIVYCDGAGSVAKVTDLTSTFNFQPLDAELTAIAGLATTDGNIIVGNGSTWVAESGATARTSLGLTIGTNVQAYDAGLQSISGLTTSSDQMIYTTGSDIYATTGLTAAGRAILDDADASAQRTTLGLTIGTNVQAYDAGLQSISGLTTSANQMIYTTGSDTYATTGLTAAGRAILDDADASAQRTTLGLAIGTDVQAYDAGLLSIAGLTTSANQMIYTTGSDTYATASLTAAGRAILDDADASAQRTTLGLAIGTDVQAYDADLSAIAALTPTDGNFIVGNGSAWVTESGATALSSLGITASAAELNYNDITTLGTSQASKVVTADADGDVILSQELTAKSYNETYATVSSSSQSLTIDCETANVFQVTLTEDVTSSNFTNPPSSGTAYGFTLRVVQGGTPRSLTWPSGVKWPNNGTAPALSSSAGQIDVFVFFTTDAGVNWYGFTAGQDFA